MKLYYSPGACSLASHIVLNEIGAPFTAEAVDLKSGKTKDGKDFKTVNPKGYIPVLQLDNGELLTEGVAILSYLAEQKAALAGNAPRYRLLEALTFIATELHKGFSPLWNDQTPEAYKNMAKERLFQRFGTIDEYLGAHQYFVGKDFSVADAYLFTVLSWANFLKIDLGRWKNIQSYMGRIAERPSVQATLKAEGLTK